MKSRRWLYLPIEVPVREADAKLLIAIHAANNGYHVVFGTKALLRLMLLRVFPPGVLLYKSSNPEFSEHRRLGHRITVHDEEGLVLLSETDSYRRFSAASLVDVDLFLCWGDMQKAIVERAAIDHGFEYPAVSVGHPRFDMLHPRFSGRARATQVKPRILINTKLAEYNNINGYDGWLERLVQQRVVRNPEELRFRKRQRDYKERLFGHYVSLVQCLADRFPQCEIVLRPHPAENAAVWDRLCSHLENVVVTNRGSVGQWIPQAAITIHTGCTTGIESVLLGCPAVSYHPEPAEEFTSDLPDRVSEVATDKEDVSAAVAARIAQWERDDLDSGAVRDAAVEKLSGHIANLTNANAHVAIMTEIDRLDVVPSRLTALQRSKILTRQVVRSLRRAVRPPLLPSGLPTTGTIQRAFDIERRYGASAGVVVRVAAPGVFVFSRQGDG